jgi:hypothetical protein
LRGLWGRGDLIVAKSKMKLTKEQIDEALRNDSWDFLNEQLYRLCKSNPGHTSTEVILAKTVIIGRTYSATLERGRGNTNALSSDDFLLEASKMIRDENLGSCFAKLDQTNIDMTISLKIHKKLAGIFHEISTKEKRSLASKYLHFHFPDHFYIYDSRVKAALTGLVGWKRGAQISESAGIDYEYAILFYRCEEIMRRASGLVGRTLCKREIDKILLHYASKNEQQKRDTQGLK